MLYRLLVCLCLSGTMTICLAATAPAHEALAHTVFELERSVAILQLSAASLEDYQALDKKVASLEGRVNFLTNLTFLLVVVGLVFLFQLRRQHKRLLVLENNHAALEGRSDG